MDFVDIGGLWMISGCFAVLLVTLISQHTEESTLIDSDFVMQSKTAKKRLLLPCRLAVRK